MSDRDKRSADERAEDFGSVWSPHDVKGTSGVGAFALVLGLVALVLAVVDRFPLVTFVLAIIGFLMGLRLFLPRLTTLDKVLLPLGMLASLAALVVQLLRLAQ